ncbi:MAG: ferredoxin reductase [Deltaproteobacteria bacterium]|jgi:stearoyl-CoA 9-desaturase NADPH oxidoreductase|nr:ferredoxin reductase [Deltaproteobacteria bacterium]MBT6435773.1 ferredoxin reductase [Deltaproteobacteria bacterium]MBT6488826.1 ferredoxin reductase [Deltaproteobacteria bacterium]
MTSLPQISNSPSHWYRNLGREFSRAMVNNSELGSYIEPLVQHFKPYWSTNGHRAQVIELLDESPEVFSIILKPSPGWPGFHAGQFVEISVNQNGRRLSRCFSISSSPSTYEREGTIRLTVRIQEQGRVTPRLRQTLQAGDFIGLSMAKGEFILAAEPRPRLLIAGGSGITPFRSMLGQISQSAESHNTTLMYYSGQEGSHLFEQELKALSRANPHINVQLIATQEHGRFNAEHLADYCPGFASSDIYICGPTGMIQSAKRVCVESGASAEQIHFEYFGAAPIEHTAIEAAGFVAFNKSGQSVSSEGDQPKSILSLAEQSGLNPQSGCKMGLCGQCQCTKTSGVVYNTKTGLHSDTGRESIKLCISVPVGDVAVDL